VLARSHIVAGTTCGTVSVAETGCAKLKHFRAHAAIAAQSSAALFPPCFTWCMQPSSIAMDADASVIFAKAPAANGTMATAMAIKAARTVRLMLITGIWSKRYLCRIVVVK